MIKESLASIGSDIIRLPKLDYARNKVGIQIGESSIKVVEVKKEKNLWNTTKTIIEDLPKGMVVEGKVLQPELLGLKIKEIFSNNQISTKKVSVFLEELPFFIRNIPLPKMGKKEREKAIFYNAQLEIPVEPAELTFRYSLFQEDDIKGERQKEYIIFGVYTSLINRAVQAVHAAGLSINSFGLEPDAIYEGLKEKKIIEKTKDSFMIVRTDTHRMMLAIYHNERLVYSRYVPFTLHKIDWEQEIQRTLVSWNGKNQESRIKEVLLLGKKEHWENVKRRVEEFMPISVRLVSLTFTACFGISLKQADEVNFYTDRHRLLPTQLSLTTKILIPVVTLLTITLSYVLVRPPMLQNDIDNLKDKIREQKDVVELVKEEKLARAENEELNTIKGTFEENNIDILKKLRAITFHQAANIQLTDLSISDGYVNIVGEGKDQEGIVTFLKGLQKESELEEEAHLSQSSEGTDNLQFSIEIGNNNTSEDEDSAETE